MLLRPFALTVRPGIWGLPLRTRVCLSETLSPARMASSSAGTDLLTFLCSPAEPPKLAAPLLPDIEAIHALCCERKEKTYSDPSTGYSVFTSHAHRSRGLCCGSACRHCPYGHFRVLTKPPYFTKRQHRLSETALLRVGGKQNITPAEHAKRYKRAVLFSWGTLEVIASIGDGDGEASASTLLVIAAFEPGSYQVVSLPSSSTADSASGSGASGGGRTGTPLFLNRLMDACLDRRVDLLAVAVPWAAAAAAGVPTTAEGKVLAEAEKVLGRRLFTADKTGIFTAPADDAAAGLPLLIA